MMDSLDDVVISVLGVEVLSAGVVIIMHERQAQVELYIVIVWQTLIKCIYLGKNNLTITI